MRCKNFAGRSIHGQVIRFGFCDDVFVQNSLISLYSTCGIMNFSRKMFDEMPNRDAVSWNSMIVGYLRSGNSDESLSLFRRMRNTNIVAWNSIITGFVQGGRPEEALELFHEIQAARGNVLVRRDKITIASVLSACGHLGVIGHGKWVHNNLRSGLECDVVIGTTLIDMYGKCGSMEQASKVFEEMLEKDTLACMAMISVLALQGFSKEAFDVYREMEMSGIKPIHVTFVGLLSACSDAGLVQKGHWCLDVMKRIHSIEPQVYLYACRVDILNRPGLFKEAERVIAGMPMKPDVFVWGALLGGCQMHGNTELGERLAKYLITLEPRFLHQLV